MKHIPTDDPYRKDLRPISVLTDSHAIHEFKIFEIVAGERHYLHTTASKLDALAYVRKYSDVAKLYIHEVVHCDIIYSF